MASQPKSPWRTSAGRVTITLFLSFIALCPMTAVSRQASGLFVVPDHAQIPILSPVDSNPSRNAPQGKAEQFTLRHLFHHGTYLYPSLHRRKDVLDPEPQLFKLSDDGQKELLPPLMVRTQSTQIQRLVDRRPSVIDPMVAAARESGEVWALSPSAWTFDEIPGPNITDKSTVLSLAEMAAQAYVEVPRTSGWENVNIGFNTSTDFGWEGDGLRGHVFANEGNSTIIISLKGTTVAVFDGEDTTTNDKENDNLLFSCCCAQQGQYTWRQVCDCATSTYSCNTTCVVKALRQENRYYQAARELYTNVTALYPDSNVWISGHSLGGAIGGLLGLTYGLTAVTFESPPERLAARRLGLPQRPSISPTGNDYSGIFHFGHTADPIYLGSCNGVTSACSFAGYAMETACHTGVECVYDVVGDKNWRVALSSHSIRGVIDNVIKKYDTVPTCEATPQCEDCPLWEFYNSNSSAPTTSSSVRSSKTRTRTETCKTPGWWGCLDETTTSTGSTTTSITTTTTTTSTCKTPGWFGCKDETTTTSSSTKLAAPTATKTISESTTSSCATPGFFYGCKDPTPKPSETSSTSAPECQTPGYFRCRDKTSPLMNAHPITSGPVMPMETL